MLKDSFSSSTQNSTKGLAISKLSKRITKLKRQDSEQTLEETPMKKPNKNKKKAPAQPVKAASNNTNSKYPKVIEVYKNQKDCFEDNEKYKNMGFSTRSIQ